MVSLDKKRGRNGKQETREEAWVYGSGGKKWPDIQILYVFLIVEPMAFADEFDVGV